MNKCKYCEKELIRSESSGYYVCECEKGQKNWELTMKIQMLKKELNIKQKQLNDLDEENE